MEIETLDELDDHLDSDGPLRGLRLQDLDLTSYGDRLAAHGDLTGLVVLGGTVPVPVAEKRGCSPCAIGAHTIGTVGSSWNRHGCRGSLVSCSDENKGGGKPATYADPKGKS